MHLGDITIIDLTRILSGPYCTLYFADLGATVIKVEPPGGDDTRSWGPPFIEGESAYFLSINRNKKSVVLDLKTGTGVETLENLIRQADVVVENFRPGTLERLGLGFPHLQELNPRLILASISGFGQTGPYRDLPGYDVIAQGMGGLMGVTGYPGMPPTKPGFSLADVGAGMWAIIGILTALHSREATGRGQWVDISLLDTIISWQTYLAGNFFATEVDPVPLGNAHPNICPYQTFPTQNGFFNLAVGNDKLWRSLCEVINRPEWIDDERFETNAARVTHRDCLVGRLEELFVTHDTEYWMKLLQSHHIPCGPIYRFSEIYQDPHVRQHHMVFKMEHPRAGHISQVNTPIKFSGDPEWEPNYSPPPLLGQHNAEILEAAREGQPGRRLFSALGENSHDEGNVKHGN